MVRVFELVELMEQWAPPALSEEWDNTGLLVGDVEDTIDSIMTCLTLTPDVAAEAERERAGLIISHHPVLFRAVQRLTSATSEGRMLLRLIRQGTAIYSPHTSWDSAETGINQQLAECLELAGIAPLRPLTETPRQGSGRWGQLPKPVTLKRLVDMLKARLSVADVQYVGDDELEVSQVGIACGAAAEFLGDAATVGCQVLITGEARFHACLDARTRGMGLILPGHYMTERPAMEALAVRLARQFPKLRVWASQAESDPVKFA